MTVTVAARGIVQRFGNRIVLNELDLDVYEGEVVALFGPSGSGKTTLLNLIGALMQPADGTIEVLGKNITRMRDGARTKLRRQLGFIFQSPTLLSTYSAIENIDLALRLPGIGLWERNRRARTALDLVGLRAWEHHMPDELSGGQQQRIAIARVLALKPRIVLADEPTSGLDTRNTRAMLKLFKQIAAEEGTTFLIVSHDQLVTDYVDTAYDLADGQLHRRELSCSD